MIRMMVAAVAVLAVATPVAAAAPARTNLRLSYRADAGHAAVVLRCDPAGGAHPRARKACALLKTVGGRPERLRPAPDAMCTMEYAPVTAEITGTWKGRRVAWSRTFGNRCALSRTAGVLFRF